jgi:hypothetical protein
MSDTDRAPIDLKAILAIDPEIWPKTVGPLARSLVAYIDAQGLDYYDRVQLDRALYGLTDDLRRIAAILYPKEFADILDFEASRDRPPRLPNKISIPADLRWAVFERDDFRCQRCGKRSYLCADHKIPESRGGETTLENLQTLCKSCNSRKSNRMEAPIGG